MMTTWTYEWILAITNTNHITILLVASISGSWNIFIGITLHLIGIIVFFTFITFVITTTTCIAFRLFSILPIMVLDRKKDWLFTRQLVNLDHAVTRNFRKHKDVLSCSSYLSTVLLLQTRALGVAPVALFYSVLFLLVVLYFPPLAKFFSQ